MYGKVRLLIGSVVTRWAFERFLPCVSAHVFDKVRLGLVWKVRWVTACSRVGGSCEGRVLRAIRLASFVHFIKSSFFSV